MLLPTAHRHDRGPPENTQEKGSFQRLYASLRVQSPIACTTTKKQGRVGITECAHGLAMHAAQGNHLACAHSLAMHAAQGNHLTCV